MPKRIVPATILALGLSAAALAANYSPWKQPSGDDITGVVINCATGQGRTAVPCGGISAPMNVMSMPFVRATQNTFTFPATTTPQQFLISQPPRTTTYRAFNPCVQADVRITSVKALEPVKTAATDYPGVLAVTSRTETVHSRSGTRFGRGSETLGSAANPMGGADRIVSIMLVSIPGYPADLAGVTCEFELGYGNGG